MRVLPGIGLLLLGAIAGLASDPPTADKKPAGPTVAQLVEDLGHPAYSVREKAFAELWKRGAAAIPALEKAARDPDPEVAKRARELLDKFAWGILPDTPPEVLKLIRQFQAGPAEERKAAVADLLRQGKAGRAAVRAILLKDLPPDARNPLVEHLTALLRREVPLLLFDGKADEAADLLALHAVGTSPEGVADFAVFHALRNTIPAAITEAEVVLKSGRNTEPTRLVLAHLHRANADWAKARQAAADFPRQPNGSTLVEMLLEEEGNWAALADAGLPPDANLPDALRLTFLRLAGRTRAFEDTAKEVRSSVAGPAGREEVQHAAFALLLNNKAADATSLLLEKRQSLGLLAELLIAQMRYKEAFELADAGRVAADPADRVGFDLRRARLLATVGKRDEAVRVFNQVADALAQPTDPRARDWEDNGRTARTLLRAEIRVGMRDLAAEHAGRFVSGDGRARANATTGETVFEVLFGADAVAAEALFWALRDKRIPSDRAGDTMKQVRQLLLGTAPKEAVDEAVKLLDEMPIAAQPVPPRPGTELDSATNRRKINRLLALAAVCRAAKRDARAEAAFAAAADLAADAPEVAGPRTWAFGTSDAARPWVEFGEYLLDRGRFADAAARLLDGWKRFPEEPLLLFLSGKALRQAGDAKEGDRRVELAHWVSLGNERVRGKFLDELVRRGEARAAKREAELVLRACWPRDFHFGNVMNQAARASVLARDFPTAERCIQRSLLVLMRMEGVFFVETSAYFGVPHDMLVYRARGLLAAGKVDEAMALARDLQKVTPGHSEFVSGMVPDLDKLGRTKDADELFAAAWAAYEKVLAEYPDSAWARNALAGIGANCRRKLDESLTHATVAVAAEPTSAGYRETLAEVHFRRGEREKALELMTKLSDEHPRNRFYRRQLTRYKSGDIASPLPETEDD
jgi:tetratricopeptide (TPR) repeat protein